MSVAQTPQYVLGPPMAGNPRVQEDERLRALCGQRQGLAIGELLILGHATSVALPCGGAADMFSPERYERPPRWSTHLLVRRLRKVRIGSMLTVVAI